jgi:hypothetical protein
VKEDETGEREKRNYYTTEESMILLIPLSPVIMMLHHPRVVQTRKAKAETEKRMYCSKGAGTRRLIKIRAMVRHVCGAMRYKRKIRSRSLTRKERKQKQRTRKEGRK